MKTLKKAAVLGASSALALSGIGGGAAIALADNGADAVLDAPQEVVAQEANQATDIVMLDAVQGDFSFTQQEISPNEAIQKHIAAASKYLCGAKTVEIEDGATVQDWEISVGGEVSNSFTASFEELAQDERVQTQIMGCSCASNPADGLASVNAEVTGIPMQAFIEMAQPAEDVNTVIVASADGYQIALPLDYLASRYCPIVFDVNGAPLAESVGGTNQLWLGSTPASYFARDITNITFEVRQAPPASPASDEAREAYSNLPNIGVVYGGEVR